MKSTSILQEKSFKKCYAFNFIWKNPLKFIELTFNFKGKSLYFLFKKKINPEILPQIYSEISLQFFFWRKITWNFFSKNKGNPLGKNFWRKIPVNFSQKKITFEIWPQKYPLGSTSWRPFFQKPSPRGWFWKFLG